MHRLRSSLFIAALILCGFFCGGHAFAMHAFSQAYTRASQVVDNAKLMNPKVAAEMLEIADDTEYATGIQMILVTVPVLPQGWKPELYAQYAGKELGVAVAKPGVLMLVSKADEKVAFTMSAGLEHYIKGPVLVAILANEITPNLAKHDFQQAIRSGFSGLSYAVQGNYKTPSEKRKQWLPFAILLPLIILAQVLFGDGAAARFFGGGAWKRW